MRLEGRDDLVFSTGKRIRAYLGIVGIDETLSISEGYDDGIDVDALTLREKKELANYMIALWKKWKAGLEAPL